MKHLIKLIVLVMAMSLAACATSVSNYNDNLSARIQGGESGGVVGSYKISGSRVQGFGDAMLSYANLNVTNVTTGEDITFGMSSAPRVYSLNPGRYKIKSGSIGGPNVKGNMPLIELWAGEFDVKTGEVVNLGEISVNRIKHNVKTDGVGKTFNAITSLGTNLNDDQTFVTYEINPMSAKTLAKAMKKVPALEGNIINRPLELRFSEAEFRSAIDSAFAKTADEKLPSKARVRLDMTKSLLEMLKDRPLN